MPRFGSFELESARRQLLRAGSEIHLTPKAFDLLCLLIDAAPRVVSKSELHQRLWPNGAVSDATLVGLVKEIRRALADGCTVPPIRTAHRVGYAFNVPLVRDPTRRGVSRWVTAGKRRIALTEGENVIGRDPDANISLDYSVVSRRHARLIVSDDGGTLLEDLGSKNGTTVGGKHLTAAIALRDGDRFACGGIQLIYRESKLGMPTATQVTRIDESHSRR
jgi:DNA-binding winged helix-turn-helix (wHTH) protein